MAMSRQSESGLETVALQRSNLERAIPNRSHTLRGRERPSRRRVVRDLHHQRRATDGETVLQGLPTFSCIEDDLDVSVLHPVDDVRAAFEHLFDRFVGDAL